jgi:hypothetical protein
MKFKPLFLFGCGLSKFSWHCQDVWCELVVMFKATLPPVFNDEK